MVVGRMVTLVLLAFEMDNLLDMLVKGKETDKKKVD